MPPPYSIAIFGAGPQGLAALKNILEESDNARLFQPTLFEARDCVGGLWAYSDDPGVPTVLRSTLGNVSRYRNCYGDFAVEDQDGDWDDTGVYQGQKGLLRYLERYVEAFGLKRWIRFQCPVVRLKRVEELQKWEVVLQNGKRGGVTETELFDKVIVATGQYSIPVMPVVEGIERFKGLVIHSKEFKKPSDFSGKRVVVLGFGNTASDIATELVGHAEKVYLSHRRGNFIFPRICEGKPLDLYANRRKINIKNTIAAWVAPARSQSMFDTMLETMSSAAFSLRPEWRFRPAPSLVLTYPIISDALVPCLSDGSVLSTAALRQVVDARSVELDDGSRLEIDCMVLCTGYKADFSLMSGVEFEEQEESPSEPLLPRLYQNIFPPAHADSLAFLNNWKAPSGICELADLTTMAIAQIWKRAYPLPSKEQMNQEIDAHRDWCHAVTGGKPHTPKLVDEGKWRAWLHEAAGTGLNEHLGYGLQGWRYWLRNPGFCDILMSGVDSPHLARLFDGRRKRWEGARAAILHDNDDVARRFGTGSDAKKIE